MAWLDKFLRRPGPPPVPDHFLENPDLSEGQIDRKMRSEVALNRKGVRINPHLPCVESEDETTLRSTAETFQRLQALILVAMKAEGISSGHDPFEVGQVISESVREIGAEDWFSPEEQAFMLADEPTAHQCIQMSWRYEAAWVLYWALGGGEARLSFPTQPCPVEQLVLAVRDDLSPDTVELRPKPIILDEADLIYRFHWAVRQASLDGIAPGGNLDPGVVMERHHALNWLIDADTAWDEVSTDT